MKVKYIQDLPFHLRVKIPSDYMDIFEHMNVQYYLKIFSDSIFEMLGDVGMDETYFAENHLGMYAVDQRLSYFAEVKAGETVAVHSRLIARSLKALHFKMFMVNEDHRALSATLEGLAFHIDLQTRRSAPFRDDVRSIIDARVAEHNTLSWSPALSGPIQVMTL